MSCLVPRVGGCLLRVDSYLYAMCLSPSCYQAILEKFEYFPIRCRVERAKERRRKFVEDLEGCPMFWMEGNSSLRQSGLLHCCTKYSSCVMPSTKVRNTKFSMEWNESTSLSFVVCQSMLF